MDEKNLENTQKELSIVDKSKELADTIMKENNVDKVKDLTALFNLNQQKKNILRILKFDGLLDSISDQMEERFAKRANEFSNSDLVEYLKAIQQAMEKTQKTVDLVSETPPIQFNQQNVNIEINDSIGSLDADEKERISDAIKAILGRMSKDEDKENTIYVEKNDDE